MTTIYNLFNKYNQSSTVSNVTPKTAYIGSDTTFTVTGTNLQDGMGFAVQDCSPSSNELSRGTSTQRQFICTFNSTPGTKSGVVKDKPGGTALYNFLVSLKVGSSNKWLSTITPPDYVVKNILNIDFDNLPNGSFTGTGQYIIDYDTTSCHLTQNLSVNGTRNGSAISITTTATSPQTSCEGAHTAELGWNSNYTGALNSNVLFLSPSDGTCDFDLDNKCYNFTSFAPMP